MKQQKSQQIYFGVALIVLGLALILLPSTSVRAATDAADDGLLQALQTELKRSYDGLRQVEGPPLYYLGYEARDTYSFSSNAELGAIVYETERHERSLDVDVRVGTHNLDNTHQLKGRNGGLDFRRTQYRRISIDDDQAALRADIWRRTDQVYKDAVDRYTKVATNKAVTAEEEDNSDDFSVEQPSVFYETVAFPEIDKAAWRDKLRRISAVLKPYPFVYNSSVSFSVNAENRYVVTSEGTRVVTGSVFVRLNVSLESQTQDGMSLQRTRHYDGGSAEELPDIDVVMQDVKTAAAELQALLLAPIVDPYTGPAIISSRATGVFFHEILGHRLEGHRQKLEREGQTFTKMVGQPVVADFISVYDDPTLRYFNGQFLRGYYRFDSEGVPASRVSLVENGILKGFLLSRSPIANFEHSNGHGRRSKGRFVVARMGNTIVEASQTVDPDRLLEMLIEEIERQNKPYGLMFHDISGGFTSTGRGGTQSFKVIPRLVSRIYADGRPTETVRGVDIVGTPLTSFGKIIAAADDYDVFNGTCGAESGWVRVSAIAPSILVSEIEVEKRAKSSEQPPILPTPHHAPEDRP